MDAAFAFDNDLYMVFRQQIVLKWFALALFFGAAIPVLYPLVGAFLALSLRVDRYNLLRGMLPPPQVSRMLSLLNVPRLVALALLPASVLLHAFMSFGFLWALHADLTDNASGDTQSAADPGVLVCGGVFVLLLVLLPLYVAREAKALRRITYGGEHAAALARGDACLARPSFAEAAARDKTLLGQLYVPEPMRVLKWDNESLLPSSVGEHSPQYPRNLSPRPAAKRVEAPPREESPAGRNGGAMRVKRI